MPKLIFTTIGTSIFDWFFKTDEGKKLQRIYSNEIERKPVDTSESDVIKNLINTLKKSLSKNFDQLLNAKTISAEIITLHIMLSRKILNLETDKIILLHSDTLEGKFAAVLNQYLFINKVGFNSCELECLQGVNGNNAATFNDAVNNNSIDDLLNNFLTDSAHDNYDPLICFSGGYKGIIPVLSNFAKQKRIEMYYLYEGSNDVLKYKLPLGSGRIQCEQIIS